MSTQLEIVKKEVNSAPSQIALIEMPLIQDNFIQTYNNYIGKSDGERRWQQEKQLVIQAILDNPQLEKCDKFSMHTALTKLAMSNLSLNEGMSFLVPYGSKVVFMPGWKGRLEQLNEMPDIKVVHEPQVVYNCDVFEMELGERPKVLRHVPKTDRPDNAFIIQAYLVMETEHGTEVKFLDKDKAFAARAKSPTYKQWMANIARGIPVNPDGTMTLTYQDRTWNVDPPLWIANPADAWKKTIVKRTYDARPNKLQRHKELDKYEKELGITAEQELEFKGKKGEEIAYEDIPAGTTENKPPAQTEEETETY